MRLPGSVLFACNHNAIRSPMAAAMLRQLHARRIFVDSVGVRPLPIDPFAVAVMDELGISLRDHIAKSFEELEDLSFDLVVSLTPEAQHSAVELTRSMACDVEYWPSFDATGVDGSREEILTAYRTVRDTLWRRVQERFPPVPQGQV
ncbi:MAG TPA: low molecular weight phosphatase family protein [Stellaceae bacterium]|nr:low molecular weight phosphatase family protein [Stellaceae bacterium]